MPTIGPEIYFLRFQTPSLVTSEICMNHSIDFIGLWITSSICNSFLSFYPFLLSPINYFLAFFYAKALVAANTHKQPFSNACGVFMHVQIEED